MKFTTPTTDYRQDFMLDGKDEILALGSCFAMVVGQRMEDYRMKILPNPMGTLFNPQSICNVLNIATDVLEDRTTAEATAERYTFEANDGKWYSWIAASKIQGNSREECVDNMVKAFGQLADKLQNLDVLLLTLGTEHCYQLAEGKLEGFVVSNCHKMPGAYFTETILSLDDIYNTLSHTIERLQQIRPELRVLLTVSPYRYVNYGLHKSLISKSKLLLATDMLQSKKNIFYFPAYEILNDELRDYRFYASDMVHPSDVAENYIWEKFCENHMSDKLRAFLKEYTPILKSLNHRSFNDLPDSKLLLTTEARLEMLKERYPEIF